MAAARPTTDRRPPGPSWRPHRPGRRAQQAAQQAHRPDPVLRRGLHGLGARRGQTLQHPSSRCWSSTHTELVIDMWLLAIDTMLLIGDRYGGPSSTPGHPAEEGVVPALGQLFTQRLGHIVHQLVPPRPRPRRPARARRAGPSPAPPRTATTSPRRRRRRGVAKHRGVLGPISPYSASLTRDRRGVLPQRGWSLVRIISSAVLGDHRRGHRQPYAVS